MVDLGTSKKASPDGSEAPAERTLRQGERPSFGAIVGQDEMKEALLAVGASDALDGLLLRGEKGTGKSTAVRALAALLPEQRAIADCPYGCPPDDPAAQCVDCRERADPPVEERPVPFVTLPLGATRERVAGSLSVTEALSGDPEFEPGLLARANRGILYVDEVNLLEDHLVDVILDAAAAGVNHVERDGVSVSHPAAFTLIGTMNPEEGDLRPQLRDRFALQATVTGCQDLDERATVVERALARDDGGESDPEIGAETDRARQRLREARERLPDVTLSAQFLDEIVELCRDAGVDGHRADIATARAARTLAALDRRPKVIETDIRRAATLTLPHRLQSTPFEDAPDTESVIEEHFDDAGDADGGADGEGEEDPNAETDSETGQGRDGDSGSDTRRDNGETGQDGAERGGGNSDTDGMEDDDPDIDGTGDDGPNVDRTRDDDTDVDGTDGDAVSDADEDTGASADSSESDATTDSDRSGTNNSRASAATTDDSDAEEAPVIPGQERTGVETTAQTGVETTAQTGVGTAIAPDLDLSDATVNGDGAAGSGRSTATPAVDKRGGRVRTERAEPDDSIDAAASVRAAATRGSDRVESRDLRRSVRSGETGALVVFAVDASASMRGPLRAAKGVALELLRDAYQQRDEVALVTFAGEDAQVVLPPTDSVSHAARHLKELPSGDRTPLPAGIETAGTVLERADPDLGVVVLVTDGRANAVGEPSTGGDTTAGSPTEATRAAARNLARLDAHVVVVDAGDESRSLVGDITSLTDGERVPLSALSAERVGAAVSRAHEE